MDVYQQAVEIVNKLVRAGHIAYFAGGWVRDFVMGHGSVDIDIATSASPVEVIDLFPNTILVGLAFGVVIVPSGGHQFEVATFRKDLEYIDGRRPEGIEPSTPQEDSLRRDFTINGMFYDPIASQIHDYVHGKEDIHKQVIRAIGDPQERFFEDRLRMLRAFRFAARFSFSIEPETQEAIRENAVYLFPSVAMERVWQEFNKMAAYPRFDQALVEMHRLTLLGVIFPELEKLHLIELRHLVSHFAHFPSNCPAILYLMELFPTHSLDQKIEITKRIKAKNRDLKLIEFLNSMVQLMEEEQKNQETDLQSWVHLYAKLDFQICLEVIGARLPETARAQFLKKYAERYQSLYTHIKRVKDNKPLVTAAHLKQQGICPGKLMGLLLKEAESIAIKENIEEPPSVLNRLMNTSLWKENP